MKSCTLFVKYWNYCDNLRPGMQVDEFSMQMLTSIWFSYLCSIRCHCLGHMASLSYHSRRPCTGTSAGTSSGPAIPGQIRGYCLCVHLLSATQLRWRLQIHNIIMKIFQCCTSVNKMIKLIRLWFVNPIWIVNCKYDNLIVHSYVLKYDFTVKVSGAVKHWPFTVWLWH